MGLDYKQNRPKFVYTLLMFTAAYKNIKRNIYCQYSVNHVTGLFLLLAQTKLLLFTIDELLFSCTIFCKILMNKF